MVDSGWYTGNHYPRPPPRVRKTDTFIIFYLFVLHSVTCLKTCHFAACFTILWTSLFVFYVKTVRVVVTVLLILVKYLSLDLYIFICTYIGIHTQAHMYNQHTRGRATTRHRSLVERGRRKALLETMHTHTHKKKQKKKCQEKPDIHESQEKIRSHRASSKATRLILTK